MFAWWKVVRRSPNMQTWVIYDRLIVFNIIWYTCTHIGINCGPLPDIANGKVDITPDTRFESTATYSCITGHDLVGISTRRCKADGQWSGQEPRCDRKYYAIIKNTQYLSYVQLLIAVAFVLPGLVGYTLVLIQN